MIFSLKLHDKNLHFHHQIMILQKSYKKKTFTENYASLKIENVKNMPKPTR